MSPFFFEGHSFEQAEVEISVTFAVVVQPVHTMISVNCLASACIS